MYIDFILNIVGSAILTVATQLIAYPYLGRVLTAEQYGTMLTAMAIANTIGISLGNSLNNTRILVQGDYERAGTVGDFNFIVRLLIAPCMVVSFVAVTILYRGDCSYGIGTAFISALVLARAYYLVAFRIVIDYKRVVIANSIGLIGYLVGIGVSYVINWWPVVFIFGEVAVLVYLSRASRIFRECPVKTEMFLDTTRRFFVLLMATAIGQAMSYMDRFLIYPTLGSEQVTLFTIASLLGKTVGIIAGPVSGVLLTYYAKEEGGLTRGEFSRRVLTAVALCVISYFVVMACSVPVLRFLYPDYVDSAIEYLPISNAGAIVLILGNLISPTLLKFADNRWQPVIQLVHLAAYVLLCLNLSGSIGLYGFCIGVLVSNSIRFFLMVAIMHGSIGKMTPQDIDPAC